MAVKPGYKQTEVGFIPEAWEVESLNSIGRVIRGSSPRPKGDKRYYGGNVPRLMVEDVTRDRKYVTPTIDFLTVEGAKLSRPCKKGTLTVVCSGTPTVVGLPSILGVDACIHDGMLGLVHLSPTVEPEYLFYRLTDLQGQLQAAATHGGTFVNLTTKGFGAFRITVPPLPEQRTISTVLSDVDALLAGLERLIAKKRDLKQAAMQKLLSGRIRLPGFQSEWKVKTLGELFNFSGGYSASRDQLSNEGHCYLHYGDIHGTKKTCIDTGADFEDIPKLDISLKQISPCSLLEDGDVVFVDASEDDDGTSRHVVVVNKDSLPFIAGLHTIVAKSKTDELVHEYRRYCFQTAAIRKQFLFFAVGTKVSGISKSNMPKITIPVPSVPEQAAIAGILADMDVELATLEQQLAKTYTLKQGMMQELLTGRTRLL
ncbi:restriction endonuclease subunit S [Pseudomonas sp. Ps21-P2]|uniref:restriction endonuclease subunit S n=1 Tax=Pseudomonas sp. Ps21-P2 TaxID=3080331 RepID=UPI00320970C7